jgi:hypothetical protein
MSITGGSVTFEQSRKLAEYENRKVSITFNVNDEQGAEAQVLAALATAQGYVFASLGLSKPEVEAATANLSDTSEPKKRGPKPKTPPATPPASVPPVTSAAAAAMMVEDATIVKEPTAPASVPQIRTGENRVDPAAVVEEDWSAPAVAEITDVDLLSKIGRKNAELQAKAGPEHAQSIPVKIRGIVGKYAKSAKEIPQDKRVAFIDELAALAA